MGARVDTGWFQGRLADKRMSQRRLASLMGLDPGAVSLALRGKRKLKAGEVADIARLLGVDVADVMLHLGVDGHQGVRSGVERDGQGRREKAPAGGAEASWEAEFIERWMQLGVMLLRRG